MFSWLSPSRRHEAPAQAEGPEYGGTFIVAMGPPRCGKTHSVTLLACRACLHYGLPLMAQDVTGNVRARILGFREAARLELEKKNLSKAERESAEAEFEFFDSIDSRRDKKIKLYPGRDMAAMLKDIKGFVGDGRKSTTRWQGVVLFDEGAIIRESDEDFFKETAPLFGNAGLLGYVTEQRYYGVPPSLRTCVRRYLVWRGNGNKQTIDDVEYENSLLTERKSSLITVLDPSDGSITKWDLTERETPLELITPAAISRTIVERVR